MIALGILSLIQIFLLPGAVFALWIWRPFDALSGLLWIVCISVLANFAVILLLVAFGVYTQTVLLWLIAGECVAVFAGFARSARSLKVDNLVVKSEIAITPFHIALALLTIIIVVGLSMMWWPKMGGVFLRADPVGIWNPWAVSWALGASPQDTSGYTQLIPMLWSITYVLVGTVEIQAFAKSVNPMFPLLALISLGFLIKAGKHSGFILTALLVFIFWFSSNPARNIMFTGHVDMVLAALVLMVCVLLYVRPHMGETRNDLLHLAGLLALTAGLVKLNGLILSLALPFIVFGQGARRWEDRRLRLALIYAGLGVLVIGGWLGLFLLQLSSGGEQYRQVTQLPTSFQGVLDLVLQSLGSWVHIRNAFGAVFFVIGLFAVIGSLFHRELWLFCLFVCLPFLVFAAIVGWYGFRNFIPATGLVLLFAGLIISDLTARWLPLKWTEPLGGISPVSWMYRWGLYGPLSAVAIGLALLVAALYVAPPLSDAQFVKAQTALKWRMGGQPKYNRKMVKLLQQADEPFDVLTNYWQLDFLPRKAEMTVHWLYFGALDGPRIHQWVKEYPRGLLLSKKGRVHGPIKDVFASLLSDGRYVTLVDDSKYILLVPQDVAVQFE